MEVLDRGVLQRLRRNVGDEVFLDLAKQVVDDLARLRKEIVDSLDRDDFESVRHAMHELKGLAGLFGASVLARSCSDLMSLSASPKEVRRKRFAKTLALCSSTRHFIEDEVLKSA
ncbi:MAG: Hpt domain-containing protein [Actinomycetota bacterium]